MRVLRLGAALVATVGSIIATAIAGIVVVTKIATIHFPDPTLFVLFWIVIAPTMWVGTVNLWGRTLQAFCGGAGCSQSLDQST